MDSHRYEFHCHDLGRMLGPTVGCLALGAAVLHAGAMFGWWPAPRPATDIDRTILIHQAEASRMPTGASVLLIGDSSCLMNVVATRLEEVLGEPVINLATLSYLDLPTHARLVREYAIANPQSLRTVVLLMHPESLRLAAAPDYFRGQIEDFLAGHDSMPSKTIDARAAAVLGIPQLRGRILSRMLPWPLPGEYGRQYGFAAGLETAMRREGGSAIDPHRYRPEEARGNAEYRLATRIESESRRFREHWPAGVRLVVGITPTPESFALADHADRCRVMLHEWAGWLQADAPLEDLPLMLPDDRFASVAHLDADSRVPYTALLGRELAALSRLQP
ncbi:MAG: hypothetical protein H7A45_13865 [Verrucomicrobiales bacterium]|nr:hypothetical protein [Verrucomicrobiales bacterium]